MIFLKALLAAAALALASSSSAGQGTEPQIFGQWRVIPAQADGTGFMAVTIFADKESRGVVTLRFTCANDEPVVAIGFTGPFKAGGRKNAIVGFSVNNDRMKEGDGGLWNLTSPENNLAVSTTAAQRLASLIKVAQTISFVVVDPQDLSHVIRASFSGFGFKEASEASGSCLRNR